jgi:hypothetical protein
MNSNLVRPAAFFLIAASLFLAACKDNKPAEPPKQTPSTVQSEEVETKVVEEESVAEDITEPPPVVREAQLYTPRPISDLRVIYGQ